MCAKSVGSMREVQGDWKIGSRNGCAKGKASLGRGRPLGVLYADGVSADGGLAVLEFGEVLADLADAFLYEVLAGLEEAGVALAVE